MKKIYVYYIRYSVYREATLMETGAYEIGLDRKVRSFDDIDDITKSIRDYDAYEYDDIILIDFYQLLRVEKSNEEE